MYATEYICSFQPKNADENDYRFICLRDNKANINSIEIHSYEDGISITLFLPIYLFLFSFFFSVSLVCSRLLLAQFVIKQPSVNEGKPRRCVLPPTSAYRELIFLLGFQSA